MDEESRTGTTDEPQAQPQQEATTADTTEEPPLTDVEAELEEWKRSSRKHERNLKELRKKVKSLVDPEQVKTVEEEKRQAELQAQQSATEATRYKVALELGLPADLAARVLGDSEDEMREDAARLKELMGKPARGASNGAATSGHNTAEPKPTDLNALLRAAAGK